MPSKIQLDENLWFLYICLQKSDLKSIDFNAVGLATSLKPPAARMRYTRLRRQIESGTLIGTHGTPFANSSPSFTTTATATEKKGKRKRSEPKKGKERRESEDIDAEGEDDDMIRDQVGGGGVEVVERKVEVKVERHGSGAGFGYGDGDMTESESDGTEWESEDEIPLAKLRKAKLASASTSTTPITTAQNASPSLSNAAIPTLSAVKQTPTINNFEMQAIGTQDQEYRPTPEIPRYVPQVLMHTLPPFGETFGQALLGQHHGGWGQFQDSILR